MDGRASLGSWAMFGPVGVLSMSRVDSAEVGRGGRAAEVERYICLRAQNINEPLCHSVHRNAISFPGGPYSF